MAFLQECGARTPASRILRRAAQAALVSLAALPATAQHPQWARQLGTSQFESTDTAAPDGEGGVFLAGVSAGNVAGSHVGLWDVWIAHERADGTRAWIQQLGTAQMDRVSASAPDGLGGVYLGGRTDGTLTSSHGGSDAWLARYGFGSGVRIWLRQIGTSANDSLDLAVSDGELGVYAGGSTSGALAGPNAGDNDAWIARYGPEGDLLWSLQLGTPFTDRASAGAPDGAGGLFVGGTTGGALGGPSAGFADAWLARIDGAGNVLWIRQFGTSREEGINTAATDAATGVFVGGDTRGSLAAPLAGATDAWFARYDGDGNRQWIRQIGSSQIDGASACAPDGAGGLFVAGTTYGPLFQPLVGEAEGWVARYDGTGNPLWARQLSVPRFQQLNAAAPGRPGFVHIAGQIDGSLGGPSAGDRDGWFMLLGPEPAAPCLTLDFETEDDFVTTLSNGQHIDTEFGGLVTLSSSGSNAGLAIFDSSRGGPNDPSQDPDLLIGAGNVLILQTENLPPDPNDIFPRPNDDEDGGTLSFDFGLPVELAGLRLIDLDAGDDTTTVVLTDSAARRRTYAVPPDWTGDRTLAQPGQAWLDLVTRQHQAGFRSTALASEEAGFDARAVVRLDVLLGGSGGLDELCILAADIPRAAVLARNGSGVNPLLLTTTSPPRLGRAWNVELDCGAFGRGLATLLVRGASHPGAMTPFGEVLIDGTVLLRAQRPFSGSPSSFPWAVPNDVALCGMELHIQGLCTACSRGQGPSKARPARTRLSNALDLTLGF